MFCVTLTIHPDEEDGAVTLLHGTPLTGIDQENRDDGLLDLRAWYLSEAGALQAQAQLPHAHIHHQPDDNWNATWQSQWQPMEVGQRWYLTPPGDTSVTPAHRIRLALRPGLAFGNGDHPTTHLCLQALEIELRAGDRFLDVGCGSGLLGEAAQLLGAQAFGCDLNPTNLPPNAFLGSLDAVKEQSMDVAVMNIQAGTLVRLWPRLTRVVPPHRHSQRLPV